MKRLKYLFVALTVGILIWLATATVTRAEDISLSWTNPTGQETCTNAGELTTLAGTRIWQLVAEINDPTATSFVLPAMPPGEYQYVATSFTTDGEESRVSGKTTKTVASFVAAAGAPVYQVVTINNAFWLVPIGTVAAETACITEQTVNGKYAIPNTAVSWSPGSTARPVLVVTDCA